MKTATSISISTPLYDFAKAAAIAERRTFSGQIEMWIAEKRRSKRAAPAQLIASKRKPSNQMRKGAQI